MTPPGILALAATLLLATAAPAPAQPPDPAATPPPDPAPAPQAGAADPALEQYYVANAAYNRKLYPVAVSQFEAFLDQHPEHPKADLARHGLALSRYALKQYEQAMPVLATLLARPQLDAAISRDRLVMLQGQCLLLTKRKDEAKTLFIAEVDKLQSDAYQTAARAAICDACFDKGEWQDVVAWTGRLLAGKTEPDQAARGLYQQGYAHYRLRQPQAAVDALGKIAALKADAMWQTRAAYLLGDCHNLLGQFDKAEAGLAAALPGLDGKDAIECRYRLGLARFAQKKFPEARADLAACLEAANDGSHANSARFHLARCRLEAGEFEPAAEEFEALSAGDDAIAARAALWWARVFTRRPQKDYDRAAGILAKACAKFAQSEVSDELSFDHANALMCRSSPDWKTALEALVRLGENPSFPQQAEVISQRAVCEHKLGDHAASLATNDRFLASFAAHPLAGDARFIRAENLFLLNRPDEATTAYEAFLAADANHPNRTAAAYRVAQIRHGQGRWADCLAATAPLLADKDAAARYAQLPFMVGDCQFRQEKWPEAIAALAEFLAPRVSGPPGKGRKVTTDPNVDTALVQLAVACDRTGRREQALEHLATLVDHFDAPTPHLPLALAEQGRLAYEAGNLKLARQALERFVAEDAKAAEPFSKGAPAQRSRVNYYLGWIDAAAKDHQSAARRFGEVVRLNDNPKLVPDAALQQGVALVHFGDFAAAAKHFPEMLKTFPNHEKIALVVYYAGLALARQEDWANAAAQFKHLVESHPDAEFADQALYEWAWCERSAKRLPEAAKLYEQLLEKHPQSSLAVKVQSELAELNLDSGEQDKVIARLTATLETVKDEKLREDIRYQLASAHFKKGEHETAAKQFENMLGDCPESPLRASMLFQAGESRFQLGETAAARDHFAAAAAIDGSPEALAESITMRLAETQAATGQHDKARDTCRAFLERFTASRWQRNARFGLALATENAGDSAAAIDEYKRLLADPNVDLWTVRSRFQIGECLFNLQKYDEAITEFVAVEVTFKQYPDWQAKAILEVGRVLLARKNDAEAAERFKEVIQRYPKENAATVARHYLDELRNR